MAEAEEIDAVEAENPEIVAEDAPNRAVPADEGIENLKKQLQAERERREAAERRAQEEALRAHQATLAKDESEYSLVNNAYESLKAKTEALESAYANAISNNDGPLAAKLQRELAKNEAQLLQLENGRQAMAERPKAPPPAVDPVENMARRLEGQWPRSAAWIRAHPEYAKSERLTNKMVAAHTLVQADGIQADTDEYFAAIERVLGISKPKADEEDDQDDGKEYAAKPMRPASPPAAPVSRSAPSPEGRRGAIRLSALEREIAEANHMTPEQYYKRKQEIEREQRYN